MALENDLRIELLTCCPRVYPSTAPYGTKTPYVTWQHAGGDSLRWQDNTAASKRMPLIQVNVWADSVLQAFTLIQQIEERLCLAAAFTAEVQGEPTPSFDDGSDIEGYIQTFKVLGDR